MVLCPDQNPFIEPGVSPVMFTSMPGIIVICEVGAAPRGRPYPDMENGQAQGPVPTG